ncbi:MAG: S24 family peptidase [Alphaproteobacteria bacterium]|nr:S24 family peptidase [Alphaproteobacteria bacterium]
MAPGFGSRIRTAASTWDTFEAAATAIGLGYNQLRRIMEEETVPSFPAIAMLAKKSGYRFEWLAFGETPEMSGEPGVSAVPHDLIREQLVWVPELDARSAAGHSAHNDERPEVKSVFPVPLSMIQAMGVAPELLRLWEATGDSMLPDIADGDRLIVYIGEEALRDGKIYALNVGDDTLVKQLQLEPDGGLTLVSKNPSFPPRKIGKADRSRLLIAGRVMGAIKRFT